MIWLSVMNFARSVPRQIWAALAVVVLVGGLALFIDHRAYNRGFAEADAQWQQQVAEERERVRVANEEAMRRAQERIAALEEARRVRDATIARLEQEAAEDPDAARPALSVDGVRRLNQIQ